VWSGSTGVKRCGVALTSATTPAPVRNLSPSWVVSLSVATSFHNTSVGGTVSRFYMCKSVVSSENRQLQIMHLVAELKLLSCSTRHQNMGDTGKNAGYAQIFYYYFFY